MFGEDIEICHQTFKKGYNNFDCGSSSLIHFKGESTINDINYLRNFYGAMHIYFKNVFYTFNINYIYTNFNFHIFHISFL